MVATRSDRRRTGLARHLYTQFFELARTAGRDVVTCGADKIIFRFNL